MKISIPRLFALLLIVCTPLIMLGKKVNENRRNFAETISAPVAAPTELTISADQLYSKLDLSGKGISKEAFAYALKGFEKLSENGRLNTDSILTIIDFTKSSRQKRLVVIDLKTDQVVYNSVVAHGRNTGKEYAKSFSNQPKSHKSSLGFYITQETYMGAHGLSLKLDGCEAGINDRARERAIVMHPAAYAGENVIRGKGYLGRSYGCPALPPQDSKTIISKIKNGNCLFVYYPDKKYLEKSTLLNG
ncbi:murein L,D-transpeptidase catalytic domain family protein [Pollutibacter soli]|uniref:murein L,D-transpeptidase catalytic domain family protein n=1 Tax=Pollutibacter soli TaxID=3034157 RepID=UPI00301398C3